MKEYTVSIHGLDHTVLLNDEDAKRLDAAEVKAAPAPKNKAVKPAANKEA